MVRLIPHLWKRGKPILRTLLLGRVSSAALVYTLKEKMRERKTEVGLYLYWNPFLERETYSCCEDEKAAASCPEEAQGNAIR